MYYKYHKSGVCYLFLTTDKFRVTVNVSTWDLGTERKTRKTFWNAIFNPGW